MRTHAEWNVETHMRWATGPTRALTRLRISSAALLVKVMARISNGEMCRSVTSQATRWVSTRVLPEPAPAMMSSGPSGWVTASACTGFRPASSGEEVAAEVTRSKVSDACDGSADPPESVRQVRFAKSQM